MNKYLVYEIFTSIQGEGYNFGKRFTFVRLSGCNFDCIWCDQPTEDRYQYTEDELIEKIMLEGCKNVLFTGGEPLLQLKDSLIYKLKRLGFYIAIETNGSIDPPRGIDYITVSPKTGRETVITYADEVRVPTDTKDIAKYLDIKNHIFARKYYLSPIHLEHENTFDFNTLAIVYNALKGHGFNISIQLHKLMGVR